MILEQYVKYVTDDLTGGGFIELQVKEEVIKSYVQDALERVRPWYAEPLLFETVTVTFVNAQSGYVDTSDLSESVHIVAELLPIEVHNAGDYVLEEISDLLGLPAGLWDSGHIRQYAEWMQARRAIKTSMGKNMGHRKIGDKIFIDDVAWNKQKVTVAYVPLPQLPEDVTYGPAITWMKDWTRAKTQVNLANVLGKFQGGAMNFSTNSAAHRAEGNASLVLLKAELGSLQHNFITFARKG